MANVDFYVVGVSYNSDDSHIKDLKLRASSGTSSIASKDEVKSRPEVIKMMKAGKKFMSATAKDGKSWTPGAALQIVPVTTEYVKTVADKSERDNLDHLPRF